VIGVDLARQGDRTRVRAAPALAQQVAALLAAVVLLLAAVAALDDERPAAERHVDVLGLHARQLGLDDVVVVLLAHVDGRHRRRAPSAAVREGVLEEPVHRRSEGHELALGCTSRKHRRLLAIRRRPTHGRGVVCEERVHGASHPIPGAPEEDEHPLQAAIDPRAAASSAGSADPGPGPNLVRVALSDRAAELARDLLAIRDPALVLLRERCRLQLDATPFGRAGGELLERPLGAAPFVEDVARPAAGPAVGHAAPSPVRGRL
jgi:hypothetical protein